MASEYCLTLGERSTSYAIESKKKKVKEKEIYLPVSSWVFMSRELPNF